MILNEAFLKTKIGTAGYKYSVLENKRFEANKKRLGRYNKKNKRRQSS